MPRYQQTSWVTWTGGGGGFRKPCSTNKLLGLITSPLKSTTRTIYDPLNPKDGTELILYVIFHVFNIPSDSLAAEILRQRTADTQINVASPGDSESSKVSPLCGAADAEN